MPTSFVPQSASDPCVRRFVAPTRVVWASNAGVNSLRRVGQRGGERPERRFFNVGVWIVQLCCQDHIWDGIKRNRLVWIGDLHPEASVVSCIFGNQPIVRETLDWGRDPALLRLDTDSGPSLSTRPPTV